MKPFVLVTQYVTFCKAFPILVGDSLFLWVPPNLSAVNKLFSVSFGLNDLRKSRVGPGYATC